MNVLQQIGRFLGEKLAQVYRMLKLHTDNREIHRTSAEIRGEITAADIPDEIARVEVVNANLDGKVDKRVGHELMPSPGSNPSVKRFLNETGVYMEANVQADWNETDSGRDSFIMNKPEVYTKPEVDVLLDSKAEGSEIDKIYEDILKHTTDNTRHKTEGEQGKLDNLAENPNLTYATKDELEANGVIIIPVDFTDPELDLEGYITTFIQPFFEDRSFFKKPVYANFIWKTDYTPGATNVDRSILIPSTAFQGIRTFGYRFRQPVDVLDSYNNEIVKYELEVTYLNTKPTVPRAYINEYRYDSDMTIFLQEDGDGLILTRDLYWSEFYKALQNKLNPAIYLKTNNTDVYIPAAYNFVKDPERTIGFVGDIQISYLKNVNGENQLWTENRKFTSALGGFIGSNSKYELPAEGIIQKIPLGRGAIYKLNVDSNTTVLNPEILSDFSVAHTAGKNPILLLCINNLISYPCITVQDGAITAIYSEVSLGTHITGGVNDKCTVNTFCLNAVKQEEVWNCTITKNSLALNDWNYMKTSNINVVTEYPTDLSAYPDGSIFIKQQAS